MKIISINNEIKQIFNNLLLIDEFKSLLTDIVNTPDVNYKVVHTLFDSESYGFTKTDLTVHICFIPDNLIEENDLIDQEEFDLYYQSFKKSLYKNYKLIFNDECDSFFNRLPSLDNTNYELRLSININHVKLKKYILKLKFNTLTNTLTNGQN